MSLFPHQFDALVEKFASLPGIGSKSASRLAFHLMSLPEEEAISFADTIYDARKHVKFCSICQNLSSSDVCDICSGDRAESGVVCVVAEPKDVAAIERTREFNGTYHVLHGVISPRRYIGPDDVRIKELIARVADGGVSEVIMAMNPDTEGETTSRYIARLLKPFGVKVTMLAYGIPVGASLEFADDATLMRAIAGRQEI